MAGDCKSSDLGHNRFDPYHLHQIPLPFSLKWRLISDRDPVAENR